MVNRFVKENRETKYPEDHGTNEWLRILANEIAWTNRLLTKLVEAQTPKED